MKKLISILICAAMILSLIPAVAAAGVEQEFVITKTGQTADCGWEKVSTNGPNLSGVMEGNLFDTGFRHDYRVKWFKRNVKEDVYHVMFRLNVKAAGKYTLQIKTSCDETTEIVNMGVHWLEDDGLPIDAPTATTTHSAFELVGGSNRLNDPSRKGECVFSPAVTGYQDVAQITIEEPENYLIALFPNSETTASATTVDKPQVYLSGIKLVPVVAESEPEPAPTTVNYGVFVSDTACASAVTANNTNLSDATDNIASGILNPGAMLTATAEDNVPGFKFRYWVLGSAATGRYYSSDNTVTVNPYANIALTAIYTEVEEETEYIDFFNWNGDYVDSKAIADGKVTALPTATLTGYEFAHWLLEDNETELTSENYATTEIPDGVSKAMAQYTALNGYDSSNKPEGTSSTGWTRDGKLVTYSETYEFFTWLNEVGKIKAYDGAAIEDEIPLVVLEEKNGAYMIEYDEGEYDIVEAGILFGSDADVDVKSAYSKATVKRILPHGQFTAAPIANATASLQSNARGYVMYRDKEDNIKVVYSK